MKETQYNNIPKDYRRNYKKEAVEFLQKISVSLGIALFLAIMFVMA